MRAIEDLANRLTDMDWGWWPFLRLRPAKHEPLSTARVAKIALHFGPAAGVLTALIAVLLKPGWSWTTLGLNAIGYLFAATIVLFAAYRLTFAWCWNRRAARLREVANAEQPAPAAEDAP